MKKVSHIAALLRRYGVKDFFLKYMERRQRDAQDYHGWYERHAKAPKDELEQQRQSAWDGEPCISILVPAYETPSRFLKEMIDSLVAQTYPNWQLCLADGSRSDKVEQFIKKYYPLEKRITYCRLKENKGIAENTNEALKMATGTYVGLLDHDDYLAPNALYEVIEAHRRNPDAQTFYTDEDKVLDQTHQHVQPHFKPDLNWFLLRSNNYICHFFVTETALAREVGGFRSAFDGAQDYDFILRCVEQSAKTCHIPKILYHWRIHEASTAGNTDSKRYAYEAGKSAIEAHLKRQKIDAKVTLTKDLGFYRTTYQGKDEPRVLQLTRHEARKTLQESAFQKAHKWADYYVICDSHVSMQPKNWRELLVRTCQCPEVGVVGIPLYSGRRLRHAAMTWRKNGHIIPLFPGLPQGFKGAFARAVTSQNVSIVGPECFVIKAEALEKVGGMAQNLTGKYAVADLCFRMKKAGYQVVYQPQCVATIAKRFYKAKSSDADKKQEEIFRQKWKDNLREKDAYYNENLSVTPANYQPQGITHRS